MKRWQLEVNDLWCVLLGHWQPAFLLVLNEAHQLGAIQRLEFETGLQQLLLQLRIAENRAQVIAEFADDSFRRPLVHDERLPADGGEVRNGAKRGRQIGNVADGLGDRIASAFRSPELSAPRNAAHPSITTWTRPPMMSLIAALVPPVA